jgi:hypothetical protein
MELTNEYPRSMEFEHELGSTPPGESANLVALLTWIRNHLCFSKSTRAIYVTMAKEFFNSLPLDVQQKSKIPEDKDFQDYVNFKWPKIKTFNCGQKKFRWGYVRKGGETPHTIHIISGIVESAERAVSTHILVTPA